MAADSTDQTAPGSSVQHPVSASTKRGMLTASSIAFSLATTALLLRPARASDGSTPFGDFRGFFAFDQLSYAAIATTVSQGDLSRVEPFTQTGVSYYPSLWYQILGLASWYLDIGIPAAWTVFGSAIIALMVIAVGLISVSITGRAWTAALVGPALWIGPIAMAITDTWFLPLDSHATLWGPYGLLFPLNAEAVGISVAGIAIGLVLWITIKGLNGRQRMFTYSIAAAGIGLLANIHTYAFLIATAFVLAWLSVQGMHLLNQFGLRIAIAASLALALAVIAFAQISSDNEGSLTFFLLMALVAAPGLMPLIRKYLWQSLLLSGLYLLLAAPQLVHLASGLLSDDAFLDYRQVQSSLLAVPLVPFILATAPLGGWIGWLILTTRRREFPLILRTLVWSSPITLLVLTFNSFWGFAQEPYRMWIGAVTLSSIVLVVPTAVVLSNPKKTAGKPSKVNVVAAATLALVGLSWWNIGGFRSSVDDYGTIQFGASRLAALAHVSAELDGLVIPDPCIDPQELKVASSGKVAYYNPGLAWPANKNGIDLALGQRGEGILVPDTLRQAQIDYVITDSQCDTTYKPSNQQGFLPLRLLEYADGNKFGTFEVWRVS